MRTDVSEITSSNGQDQEAMVQKKDKGEEQSIFEKTQSLWSKMRRSLMGDRDRTS